MKRGHWLGVAFGALFVVLLATWLAVSNDPDAYGAADGGDGSTDGEGAASTAADDSTEDAADGGEETDDSRDRADDPEARALAEALRERIQRARALREAEEERLVAEGLRSPVQTGGSPVNGEEVPPGSLDPQYIRDAVRAIRPLIQECYELALADQEGLEGRLVVEFDIEGEADAGGVVERTSIHENSTLHHEILDECVAETLYTLELPAPEGGGVVHVRYPFGFSTAPDGEEATQ